MGNLEKIWKKSGELTTTVSKRSRVKIRGKFRWKKYYPEKWLLLIVKDLVQTVRHETWFFFTILKASLDYFRIWKSYEINENENEMTLNFFSSSPASKIHIYIRLFLLLSINILLQNQPVFKQHSLTSFDITKE